MKNNIEFKILNENNLNEILKFMAPLKPRIISEDKRVQAMVLHTLYGDFIAHIGDYIVKDKGKIFFWKPELFKKIY